MELGGQERIALLEDANTGRGYGKIRKEQEGKGRRRRGSKRTGDFPLPLPFVVVDDDVLQEDPHAVRHGLPIALQESILPLPDANLIGRSELGDGSKAAEAVGGARAVPDDEPREGEEGRWRGGRIESTFCRGSRRD